ncbi:hypothetical protein JCM8547_007140 [Rhodosporidiobolus lusitaniae]
MAPTSFPPPSTTAFRLPVLSFSASTGTLVGWTQAGADVLGLPWVDGQVPYLDVCEVFGRRASEDEERDEAETAAGLQQLKRMAEQSDELAWGESVVLAYNRQDGKEERGSKAEVLVAFSRGENDRDDGIFSILFLRPAVLTLATIPSAPPSISSPATSVSKYSAADPAYVPISSDASSIASLPLYTNSAVFSSNSSSSHAATLATGGLAATAASLASSGSGSSNSSRRGQRTTTGRSRETLPIAPDVAQMLAHATDPITMRDHSTTLSPVPSSPALAASPAAGDASLPPSTTTSRPRSLVSRKLSLPSNDLPTSLSSPPSTQSPTPAMPVQTDSPMSRPTQSPTPSMPQQTDSPMSGPASPKTDGRAQSAYQEPLHDTLRVYGNDLTDRAEPEVNGRVPRLPLPYEQASIAIETIPQIVFIADKDGRVTWMSSAWNRLTGSDDRYLLNEEEWLSTFHPDDLAGAFATYLGAMQSGEEFWFEYRIRNSEGALRWHVCQGRPHRDEEGNIENWYCTIVNIDELITTRHDALLIKERTQAVLEGSDLILLTVNTSGRVTFCEGRRPSLLPENSQPSDPIVGKKFSEMWPNANLNEAVRQVLDEEVEVAEVETQTNGEGDERHYHRYRLVPLRGDPSIPSSHPDATAVTGVIIVGRDVTDLVLAEEQLERSRFEKAQLEAREFAANEANRLKTEFLTTVSHEIRTPIASILGICELLLGEQISKEQRVLVEKALQSGENLLDLVGTVLDVRKVETGELILESAPFHLSDALSDARLFAVSAQKKGLKFVEDVQPFYEGTVLGDRLRLRQILANALSNSVKFTSQGSVSLQLRQIEENASHVTVEFVIEDTGVGISKEVLPTLFVPFRQADASTARQYGGSGLGLTIAKQLVELMGGTISLTSPGANLGSRMTVHVPLLKSTRDGFRQHLPVSAPSSAPMSAASSAQSSVPTAGSRSRVGSPSSVKVLLAEDNELIREIVTKTLRKMRFQVEAVNDGGQCLERVEKEHYDVVLMDGQMPIMDGYAATASIRKNPNPRIRNLRIIALTASAIAGDRERCLQSGMNSYLAKPVRAKELEAAIWQEIELSESVAALDSTPAA